MFFMRTRGPMEEPGACCARLDDFDWVIPPYVPDRVLAGRDGAIGALVLVGRSVRSRWRFRRWRKRQLEDRCPGLWLLRRSHRTSCCPNGN